MSVPEVRALLQVCREHLTECYSELASRVKPAFTKAIQDCTTVENSLKEAYGSGLIHCIAEYPTIERRLVQIQMDLEGTQQFHMPAVYTPLESAYQALVQALGDRSIDTHTHIININNSFNQVDGGLAIAISRASDSSKIAHIAAADKISEACASARVCHGLSDEARKTLLLAIESLDVYGRTL